MLVCHLTRIAHEYTWRGGGDANPLCGKSETRNPKFETDQVFVLRISNFGFSASHEVEPPQQSACEKCGLKLNHTATSMSPARRTTRIIKSLEGGCLEIIIIQVRNRILSNH